nr:histone deacetylase 4 [Halisarca dujardinii]
MMNAEEVMDEVDSGTEVDPPTGLLSLQSLGGLRKTHSHADMMDSEDMDKSKRPVSQTVSGSSTSSLVSQFGGLNMMQPNQMNYPMMMPASVVTGSSSESTQKQIEAMQRAQLQQLLQAQAAQAQAQAQMLPATAFQPNIMMMPGGLIVPGIPAAFMQQAQATATNPIVSSGPSTTPPSVSVGHHHHHRQKAAIQQTTSLPAVQPQFTQQFDQLMQDYSFQQERITQERKQIEQNFKDRQQALLQHQMMETQQFQEQLRVLVQQHSKWQQDLQKQSQNLQNFQQQTLEQMRHQEEIVRQQIALQAQRNPTINPSKKPIQRVHHNHHHPAGITSLHGGVKLTESAPPASSSSPGMMRTVVGVGDPQQVSLVDSKPPLSRTGSYHSVGHVSLSSRHSVGSGCSSNVSENVESNYLGGGESTGLVFESTMLRHNCSCAKAHQIHPEHPGRTQSIWSRLHERKIVERCSRIKARKASHQELATVHSQQFVQLYGKSKSSKTPNDKKDLAAGAFTTLPCGGIGIDSDTYWNEQTPQAAKTAAGCVIQLADDVASGKVKNGFAIVRPPGHHAMKNKAMGFCYFNNIALAAKSLLLKTNIHKVMIVDWDIHHGNGTQQVFYDTSEALFVSIHRYDSGRFFPGSGIPEEIGSGAGKGFNVNIAFSGARQPSGLSPSSCGDAEYLAAFRSVVIPLAYEYKPDVILVSAGFNATEGHQHTLGGYSVSPQCFGHLTRLLMGVCNGRVILALEGGYELRTLCASAEACMLALLGDELEPIDDAAIRAQPNPAAVESIQKTIAQLLPYWGKLSLSQNLLPVSHWQAHRGMSELAAMTSLAGTK